MTDHKKPITRTTTEARAGRKTRLIYVLIGGLVLVVAAFIVSYIIIM